MPEERRPTRFQPIVPSLPRAQSSLQNRLPQIAPYLSSLSTPVANSYLNYAQQRAARGQTQQSLPETLTALQAAQTGQAQTVQAPDTSILNQLNPLNLAGGAIDDIKTITGALPRMFIPNRGNPLYEEAAGLMNLPENIGAALAEGDNLGEDIAGVLNAPGVRMIPGSYVGANLAAGTPEELLAHPLFTVLDVLPYGQAAAKGTRVFGAATEARAAENAAIRSTPIEGLLSNKINPVMAETRPVRPIRTVLTKTVDETGAVVPNRFGRFTTAVGDSLSESKIGDFGADLGLGQRGRALRRNMAVYRQSQQQILAITHADDATLARVAEVDPALAEVGRMHKSLIDEHPSVFGPTTDPAYIKDLEQRWTTGDVSKITGPERKAFDDWQRYQSAQAGYLTRTDPNVVRVGDAPVQMRNGRDKVQTLNSPRMNAVLGGEVIPTRQFNRLRSIDARATKAAEAAEAALADVMAVKGIVTGADDLPSTYSRLGITDPVPARTATAEARAALDDFQTARPDERLIIREYQSAIRQLEEATSPADMIRHTYMARTRLERMLNRKAFTPLHDQLALARKDLITASTHIKRLNRESLKQAERGVVRAERGIERALSAAIPARYMPTMFDEFDKMVNGNISDFSPEIRAAIEKDLGERFYGGLAKHLEDAGADPRIIETWRREARDMWVTLKSETGRDPAFIPSVSREQAERLGYANPATHLTTPSTAKARTWDVRPTEGGPAVAMTHQMKELLEAKVSREIVDSIEKVHGRTFDDWMEEAYARGLRGHEAREWVERTTVADFPNYLKTKKSPGAPGAATDQIRVPVEMAEMFNKMGVKNPLEMVFEPVTRLFRSAVLPLSIRWHVNNIGGGAIVSMLEDPTSFMRWVEAWKAQDAGLGRTISDEFRGRTPHRLSKVELGATPTGAGGSMMMPGEHLLREPLNSTGRTLALRKWFEGTTMAKWWEQAAVKRQELGMHPLSASHAANSFFDDTYKTAININAYERAIKKGASTEAAEVAAMEAVRKTFQQWDEMLPMERVIMKSVFPFYGWAKFSLGFLMRYPADHAIRTAIMAQFARNEEEDRGTGLPEQFRHLFQMSSIDENGNAKFFKTSGLNPFRDATDWFTLEGMVGNVNPVISAGLQALGVNPMQGGPALYPDLEYDPETGGLRAKTPDYFSALLGATIPQSRLIGSFITDTNNFNELVRNDPQAARNMLYGQLGLPVLFESNNIPQELMRAESNRYDTFVEARRAAVLSGDLSGLERYPGTTLIGAEDVTGLPEGSTLQAYIEQLGLMEQQGLLEPYRSDRPQPAATDLLRAIGGYEQQLALAG